MFDRRKTDHTAKTCILTAFFEIYNIHTFTNIGKPLSMNVCYHEGLSSLMSAIKDTSNIKLMSFSSMPKAFVYKYDSYVAMLNINDQAVPVPQLEQLLEQVSSHHNHNS